MEKRYTMETEIEYGEEIYYGEEIDYGDGDRLWRRDIPLRQR